MQTLKLFTISKILILNLETTRVKTTNNLKKLRIITVDSKIIRALQIFRGKKLYLMQFYEMNICQVMIFRLLIVYNKHEMIKNDSQTREKSQVFSQLVE